MSSRAEMAEQILVAGRKLSTAEVLFHTALAARSGLSTTESKAMEIVDRLGPLTPGDLARESGLAPASVTGLLDRLTRKKVARRVPHPRDKRTFLIEANPDYIRFNDTLLAEFVTAIRELCQKYSTQELEVIERFLLEAAQAQHGLISTIARTPPPAPR